MRSSLGTEAAMLAQELLLSHLVFLRWLSRARTCVNIRLGLLLSILHARLPNELLRVKVLDFCYRAGQPLESVSVDPDTDSAFSTCVREAPLPVLLAIVPVAFVLLAVRPNVRAPAVLLIFVVFAVVPATIWPRVNSSIV
jgi:hypothetical protein